MSKRRHTPSPQESDAAARLSAQEVPWDDLTERRTLIALQKRLNASEEQDTAPQTPREPRPLPWRAWAVAAALAIFALGGLTYKVSLDLGSDDPAPSPAQAGLSPPPPVRPGALPTEVPPAPGATHQGPGAVLALPEGSRVIAGAAASLEMVEQTERVIRIKQDAGHARYEVSHAPDRDAFLVQAEQVRVRVVGTVFEIDALPQKVKVSVERGEVEVTHQSRSFSLKAGEQIVLPHRLAAAPTEVPVRATPSKPAAAAGRAGRRPASPSLEEVLVKVDGLRATGQKAQAVSVLEGGLAGIPRSEKNASAWFLLGRLRSDRLGAAEAFRTAYDLAPKGPLAEDALAAEVKSLQAAGKATQARARRKLYLNRFPLGLHVRALSELGLDP